MLPTRLTRARTRAPQWPGIDTNRPGRRTKINLEFKKSSSCSMLGGGHAARRLDHDITTRPAHGPGGGVELTHDIVPLLLVRLDSVRACVSWAVE
jgi:hypothetical protein